MLIRQTIAKKSVNIWLLFAAIAITLIAVEWLDDLMVGKSPVLRTLIILSIIGSVAYYSYNLIYYRLAEYHYKIISDEIIFEKVIGRGNHVVLNFKHSDLLTVERYDRQRIARRDVFCHLSNKRDRYVVTFTFNGRHKRLVIAPDQALLDFLVKHAKRVEQ